MIRTRVKICGVRDAAAALVAAEAGADAVGLVFVERSPRHVTLEQAKQIVAALPALVQPIGLFADAPVERIREVAGELGLHTVQLHGSESPRYAAELAPLRVIKALAFDARRASEVIGTWRSTCPNLAAMLFDAPPPESEGDLRLAAASTSGNDHPPAVTGGTGRTLDWAALGRLVHGGMLAGLPPHILAGGLNPENVGRAIEVVRPYAVDVSSGIESSRGVKDATRIRAFLRAVSRADIALHATDAPDR